MKKILIRRLLFFIVYFVYCLVRCFMYHWSKSAITDDNAITNEIEFIDKSYSFNTIGRRLLSTSTSNADSLLNCTPLALENFPNDLFSQSQRQHGAIMLHIFVSIYMFIALAILCDEYFISCLEKICEALNLQPDVAGATFMAAGSSAPELATTLVGVFIAKDDIGLGSVVGSADFNIMLVISVSALFAKEAIRLNWWPLIRDSAVYLISIILLALVIADKFIYWYESLLLLVFYGLYVLLMYFNPRIDSFLRLWCIQHPHLCPTAMHFNDSEQPQPLHTGIFGQAKLNELPLTTDESHFKASSRNYERLSSEIDDQNKFATDECVIVTENFHSGSEHNDAANFNTTTDNTTTNTTTTNNNNKHMIGESDDSWADMCFSRLKLPPHDGIRGKIRYSYFVLIWPINFLLCTTIPDIRHPKWKSVPGSFWITFVMSCFWIGLFTIIMIWMITVIGVTLNIPDNVMGLTFIAAGSSVPDAIASILVVREGEGDMAISNALGSNVFDILICMGLPWFLKSIMSSTPVIVYSKGLLYSTLTLFVTVVYLIGVTHWNGWRLTKRYGYALLVGYLVVLLFCSLYELNYFGIIHLPSCPLNEY